MAAFVELWDNRHTLIENYDHWKHEDHANFGKPFERFLFNR